MATPTTYRIDGTHRTYTQLFPIGNGAKYDDYGYQPATGHKKVTIPGHGHIRVASDRPTITVASSPRVTVPHSSTVTVTQTSTITLPEE